MYNIFTYLSVTRRQSYYHVSNSHDFRFNEVKIKFLFLNMIITLINNLLQFTTNLKIFTSKWIKII